MKHNINILIAFLLFNSVLAQVNNKGLINVAQNNTQQNNKYSISFDFKDCLKGIFLRHSKLQNYSSTIK